MSKVLSILKFVCLIILITLNFVAFKSGISMLGWNHVFYLILLGLFLLVTIGDFIKKNGINNNKRYNILCIVVFVMSSAIFLRALFDPHFTYNNHDFMSKLDSYYYELYKLEDITYEDYFFPIFYISQNINYFIGLFFLLYIYRFINKDKIKKKTTL